MDIHLSSWLRKRGLLLTVQPFESETRRQAAILGVAKDLSECGEQQAAAFLEKDLRRGDDVSNDEGEEIGNLVLHFSPSHEQEPGVRLTVRCANLAVNQASNFLCEVSLGRGKPVLVTPLSAGPLPHWEAASFLPVTAVAKHGEDAELAFSVVCCHQKARYTFGVAHMTLIEARISFRTIQTLTRPLGTKAIEASTGQASPQCLSLVLHPAESVQSPRLAACPQFPPAPMAELRLHRATLTLQKGTTDTAEASGSLLAKVIDTPFLAEQRGLTWCTAEQA